MTIGFPDQFRKLIKENNMFDKEKENIEYLKKEDTVSCAKCGCLILIEDAKKVEVRMHLGGYLYFCHTHKPPYDKINAYGTPITYHGEVEMKVDGTPIGYVKEKKS